MSQGLRVLARVKCQPEKLAELKQLWLAVAEQTRREPGCISYELVVSADDPNELVSIEQWRDGAAIEAHFAQPYMQDLLARAPGLVAAPPEIKNYRLL